jgi:3-methyladenine DNA glycosylase AlkC
MAQPYSPTECAQADEILALLEAQQIEPALVALRCMKDSSYAAIPEKKRISTGITWVLKRIAVLLASRAASDEALGRAARQIFENLQCHDHLLGAPLFMMAESAKNDPGPALAFFEQASLSPDWVVREFAAAALHTVIPAQRDLLLPALHAYAQHADHNLRRMAAEALRPVSENRWIQSQPEFSLGVLQRLFQEPHPYPRTSVGNNLSDLGRGNPELIFSLVAELVASRDPNSTWIAHRACRNLVKQQPLRVLDLLGVDEYHYKDRNFYRGDEYDHQ